MRKQAAFCNVTVSRRNGMQVDCIPFPQEEKQPEETAVVVQEEKKEELKVVLSPEEQKMVDNFAAQIDLTNTQMVLQYGGERT